MARILMTFTTHENKLFLWFDSNYTHYFLISENQNIPPGNFLLFNLTGKKKKVAPTAITSFEITEEEANHYFVTELNQLLGQIEISEDIQQDIPKMLEEIFSNIEKYLPDFVTKLGEIEEKIEDNPESLAPIIYDFYTSLSQDFFIKREKRLEERRQKEVEKSAKEAVKKALNSFSFPTFIDTDWSAYLDYILDNNDQE